MNDVKRHHIIGKEPQSVPILGNKCIRTAEGYQKLHVVMLGKGWTDDMYVTTGRIGNMGGIIE